MLQSSTSPNRTGICDFLGPEKTTKKARYLLYNCYLFLHATSLNMHFEGIVCVNLHATVAFWGPLLGAPTPTGIQTCPSRSRLEASIRQVLSGSVSRSFPPGLLFSDFGIFGGRKLAVKLKIHKSSSLLHYLLCCLRPFWCCQTA